METIAYTIGSTTTEIALGALGVGLNVKLEFGTHGESTCTLPLPALPFVPPQFHFQTSIDLVHWADLFVVTSSLAEPERFYRLMH